MSDPKLADIDQHIDFKALQTHFADHKECRVCGTTYENSNPAKLTCSSKCRQRLYRVRLKVKAKLTNQTA